MYFLMLVFKVAAKLAERRREELTLCFVVDFWIIAALRRQQIYSDPKHTLTLCIEQPFFKLFENDTFLTHVLLLQHRL